jgi:hypothetical protein
MATQAEISQVVKGWRVSETRSFDGSIGGAFMQSLRTGFKKRGWQMVAYSNATGVEVKRVMISPRGTK